MKKKRQTVPLAMISLNTGQLAWLPKNPRQWTATDIERTASSITEDPDFLEDRPLLVTPLPAGGFVAFAGNLRHEGAVKAGLEEVPCVVYRPENGQDYETIKRRAMKDNGSFGSWDYDTLANEWDDLPLADWGVPAWDTMPEDGTSGGGGGSAEEDDFDEEKDAITVRCKTGDIWQLGEHRLMCGDSIDLEQVKKLMGGVNCDLWLTDPPYNVNYREKEEYEIKVGVRATLHKEISNDNMTNDEFLSFLVKAYQAAYAVMKPGAVFYIWHSDSEGYNFRRALVETGKMKLSETLIWVKNGLCLGRMDYHWKHEPCLYGWKEGAGHKWYSDRKQTTTFEFEKPSKSAEHPTMKPVALFGYLIQNSTKANDIVLDTFGGSGTTVIACEQLGRKCYMMELDPHYCDVILARWEKLTGKEATKKL